MSTVPGLRIKPLNQRPPRPDGRYVLYWMVANRRGQDNHALDRALWWCEELKRPLLVLEALRLDYPWASPRLHAFILGGMADNQAAFQRPGVFYYPYVEPAPGAGKGLLAALAQEACLVVSDLFPCFFVPAMQEAAAARLEVLLEVVDSCGLLPLAASGRAHDTAHAFRRVLQRELPGHLAQMPQPQPLEQASLPRRAAPEPEITRRWPLAGPDLLAARPGALARLPLAGQTPPAPLAGGPRAALAAWDDFLDQGLEAYASQRNQPRPGATSGLSPYLHFGHLSPARVFADIAARENWAPHDLDPRPRGKREGYWGMSPSAEAFLDQLITWRELGYHFCHYRSDYGRYDSLPAWARTTLAEHLDDPRPYLYSPAQLEAGQTHDPLWNAAQKQLRGEGMMAGYLRMLWGKKILEWSPSPQEALEVMLDLNNRYALDGRDPNSYSGVFWCLGRFDRPFGPVRPVFGKVRYMTSANTARKLRVGPYLERYGD